MIKTMVVPLVVDELKSITIENKFEIIDAEINSPEFGYVTLYYIEDVTGAANSFHLDSHTCEYIISSVGVNFPNNMRLFVKMPSEFGSIQWQSVCKLIDSKGNEYYLLVNKP